MSKKNNGGFLLGAIIGGAAAAAAALLMAPKTGEETRKDLKNQVDDLKAMSEDYTKIAKEKSEEALTKAQELKDSTLSTLKKRTDELSDELKQTAEDAEWEDRLDNLVDDAHEIVLDVQDMSGKAVDKVKDAASDLKANLTETAKEQTLAEDAKELKDEAVQTVKEVKDDVVSTTKEVKEDVKDDWRNL